VASRGDAINYRGFGWVSVLGEILDGAAAYLFAKVAAPIGAGAGLYSPGGAAKPALSTGNIAFSFGLSGVVSNTGDCELRTGSKVPRGGRRQLLYVVG
jgi:hypothetical protein